MSMLVNPVVNYSCSKTSGFCNGPYVSGGSTDGDVLASPSTTRLGARFKFIS